MRITRRQALAVLATLGALAAAAATHLGWLVRVYTPRFAVTERVLRPAGWTAPRPVRIAFVTDTHTGAPFNGLERLQRIVEATNALGADVILLGGDYVYHGIFSQRPTNQALAQVLGGLRAPGGVFAVLGNHDYWDDPGEIGPLLEAQGIGLLHNRQVAMDDGAWFLAGVSDMYETRPDPAAALAGIPEGAPVLMLSHGPDLFPVIPRAATVVLSGHTHGGQVALPVVGAIVVPSAYGRRYAYGVVEEAGHTLVVSSGLGTTGLPIRRGVPAEILVLTLEPEAR